ncbi:MAG: hypothetical protein WC701_04255 [Kiritimatiellales bacterium]
MRQESIDSFLGSWYGRFIVGFIFGIACVVCVDFSLQVDENIQALLIEASVWGALTGGLTLIFGDRFLDWVARYLF